LHVRRPTTPKTNGLWFGLFPFRSPLLGKSLLLSLPQGTEMFQFPWLPPNALCVQANGTRSSNEWVTPFGDLRIDAYLQLPEAYRCSSRPSSAPDAKASTVCP